MPKLYTILELIGFCFLGTIAIATSPITIVLFIVGVAIWGLIWIWKVESRRHLLMLFVFLIMIYFLTRQDLHSVNMPIHE